MNFRGSQKLVVCVSIAAGIIFGCKPRQDSDLKSYQSLHKGGITLLWYGEKSAVNVCVLQSPLTDATKIENMEQFQKYCGGGKTARLSDKEFATMSSEFLSNTTFKSLIRGKTIAADYTLYAERAVKEKDLIKQTSAVAMIMSQLEALEYQLSKSQKEFNTMESFLTQTSTDKQRPTDTQIQEIYGDAYKKVKTTVDELNKNKPVLEANLKSSAEILSNAVDNFLALRQEFEGRIQSLITEIFAADLKKTSLLFENSIDYALFTNVAVQLGLIDGVVVGVTQTASNADLAKVTCTQDGDHFSLKNGKGTPISPFKVKKNCEDAILTFRKTNTICPDELNTVVVVNGPMIGDPFTSFELCNIAAASATKAHVCAPSSNSFKTDETGIYTWSVIDQSRGNKFELSPTGLKQCIEQISRMAQVEVVGTLFKAELFNNLVKLPTSASTPSPSQSGNVTVPTSGKPAGNAQPSPKPQPAAGPAVTPVPETLPVNSDLAVDEVVNAMNSIKKFFKVDDGTRDGCLSATMGNTSLPWSDIMAHYYCQYPIYDSGNTASVRACFTGTLRGQGGYPKKDDFRAAFDACINRMEFNWIRSNNLMQFQYIMLSQRDMKDPTQMRFSLASQREALSKFYGGNIPVRKP